eukprot:Pgem_evm1s3185
METMLIFRRNSAVAFCIFLGLTLLFYNNFMYYSDVKYPDFTKVYPLHLPQNERN